MQSDDLHRRLAQLSSQISLKHPNSDRVMKNVSHLKGNALLLLCEGGATEQQLSVSDNTPSARQEGLITEWKHAEMQTGLRTAALKFRVCYVTQDLHTFLLLNEVLKLCEPV